MRLHSRGLLATLTLICAGPLRADGSEALGAPSIPVVETGRAVLAGTGLVESQPGSIAVALPADAAVTQVLAYWDGLDSPADSQGESDTVLIGGHAVTGARIGGSTNFFKNYWVSSYRADITALGLVGAGESLISVEGLDFSHANNGLALVVITEDERSLVVRDGLDYGHANFGAPFDQSEPVTYGFDPSGSERQASVGLIVGGIADQRPNVIEVRVDGVLTVEEIDLLHSNAGAEFDVVELDFSVPAGATEVTVQILSEDRGGPFSGNLEASFTWLHASLSLEGPSGQPEFGCDPHFWWCNWWRWDPWCTEDNSTDTIVLTDRFNDTFGVSHWRSGLWYHAKLWHSLKGWGSWWYPARRKLNREASAALANADSNIGYPLTVEEVKALYRDAVGAEDGPETVCSAFWLLYDANRLGCPW